MNFKWGSLLALLLFFGACSRKYMVLMRSIKALERQEINRRQYDSIVNDFYTLKKSSFIPNHRIKFNGSYVLEERLNYLNQIGYRTIKFSDSGYVVRSAWFSHLSNDSLTKVPGAIDRYSSTKNNDNIVIEYLLTRDYDVYNIYKYATISENGNKLVIYRTKNLQAKTEKPEVEAPEIYYFNDSITALPKLPK